MSDQGENCTVSSLPDITVTVKGFRNEDAARAIGNNLLYIAREIGRVIDLATLDGITVAIDFDAALAELDRGVEGLPPITRTNDSTLIAVGKSLLVRRGDEVRTHLVFDAGPVCCLALEEPDPAHFRLALAVIAHECAHVEEHARRERQFPGTLLGKRVSGFRTAYLQQFSEAFWCEYAVCRASARFAQDEGVRFRELLSLRLQPARHTARHAIKAYRIHGDVERVFGEVGSAVLEPLRTAAYLFGHLDGLAGDDLSEIAAELATTDEVFVSGITTLVTHLRSLWEKRDRWQSHDDMLILGQIAFEMLRKCGVDVQPRDGGDYIDVPFTFDTLPD